MQEIIGGGTGEEEGQQEAPTVTLFPHPWLQPSVIATIPGIGPNKVQVLNFFTQICLFVPLRIF